MLLTFIFKDKEVTTYFTKATSKQKTRESRETLSRLLNLVCARVWLELLLKADNQTAVGAGEDSLYLMRAMAYPLRRRFDCLIAGVWLQVDGVLVWIL